MVKSFIRMIQTDFITLIHIDKSLTWKHDIHNVAMKLSKANAMLSKTGHYIDIKTLKSSYNVIFESFMLWLIFFGHKIHYQLKDFLLYKKIAKVYVFYKQKCSLFKS